VPQEHQTVLQLNALLDSIVMQAPRFLLLAQRVSSLRLDLQHLINAPTVQKVLIALRVQKLEQNALEVTIAHPKHRHLYLALVELIIIEGTPQG
jgi:hypothetical protein